MSLVISSGVVLKQPTGASWRITPTNLLPDDADAVAYIAAVEAADTAAGSPGGLEPAVRLAINSFIKGCKADGIWPAIKASCILAGARTLNGALVPLAGTAPTNYNFVAGDYNRKTGLVGNGSTKYLDSNRNNNADPQDNQHASVYLSSVSSPTPGPNIWDLGQVNADPTGATAIGRSGVTAAVLHAISRYNNNTASVLLVAGASAVAGFKGVTRSGSTSFTARVANANYTKTATSAAPVSSNITLFNDVGTNYSANRLAFYSIGESLDLALLDTRVTALVNALAAAIP